MKPIATESAQMPKGTSSVLDARSLENSYASLLPLLHNGMRVLDVGCGTGAITAGIANAVGPDGTAVGIDSSAHLIAKGREDHAAIHNLQLAEADLFSYTPEQPFDLVVSARVLQWLSNPVAALEKFKSLLRPGGCISILDYNHTAIEWNAPPPQSMRDFYAAFLQWRADAGMDNAIGDHLAQLFLTLGLQNIRCIRANEVCKKGEDGFLAKAGLWTKVAELRGPQMVQDGYITEAARLQAITDYNAWLESDAAQWMAMKLNDVQGSL
ncbi:methyltransferase type 12 [Chitinophaga parva]|uniref:Methyltransferase type 12 n=1 Tax=Chitinophaga parva TaxID=2169414 RepID=A0A2T7BJI0_9BACT|nr:class I SAM-dependent methyltransferase [Chitinophaga parva]PUZ26438.1 methyltransferase type 12 [Chitinophaga parva]